MSKTISPGARGLSNYPYRKLLLTQVSNPSETLANAPMFIAETGPGGNRANPQGKDQIWSRRNGRKLEPHEHGDCAGQLRALALSVLLVRSVC